MKIWEDPVEFEWDGGNSNKNLEKHNVSDQEAEEIFSNEPLIISENKSSTQKEIRYFALGITDQIRPLYIVFTMRGKSRIRVISARQMTKQEEKIYAKA